MTYYDEIAPGYNELHKAEQMNKLRIIAQNLKLEKDSFLLDVGCGTGFSLDLFDCNKIGVDPSIELLKQCRHNVMQACAESLPFKDKSFDAVICVTAIHNFSDISKGLSEINRVAKDQIALSILRKAGRYDYIKNNISKLFQIIKIIKEEKDTIFICRKPKKA